MAQKYATLPNNNFSFEELVENLSDDDLLENTTTESDVDMDEIKEFAAEIIQQCDDLPPDEEPFFQNTSTEDEVHNDVENAIDQLNEKIDSNEKSCANCSKPRRVTQVSSLKRGQHISMPGQSSTKYVEAERKLKKLYNHHAIIKEIKSYNRYNITLVLIHFTDIKGKLRVCEETKEFDLRENELYIIDYVFPRYEPDTIVARAESVLSQEDKFKSYNLVRGNCEHFATWCVVGEGESFQVQSIREKLADSIQRLASAGSKIAKGILRLFKKVVGRLLKAAPEIAIGATSAIYCIYPIIMTILHIINYVKGRICKSCLKRKLLDLWLAFGAFGLTSGLVFLVIHFALSLVAPGVGVTVMILLISVAIAFQMNVLRLRKALSSPFSVDRVKVISIDEIGAGDVISIRHHGIERTSIVTEVQAKNDIHTRGSIRLVHYNSAIFGTRKIVEEIVEVDIEKSSIYLFDCKTLSTFPAEVVVNRARSKIGERKWALFSNRSDHFSYWVKVQQFREETFDESSNENISEPLKSTQASLFVEEREIHCIQDLRIGDVVKSNKIGGIHDTGILSRIRYLDDPSGRKIEMEVLRYSFSWKVIRKTCIINLNIDRLYVDIYNPAQCYSMEQRAKNARKLENKKCPWWTTQGFIRDCIERK